MSRIRNSVLGPEGAILYQFSLIPTRFRNVTGEGTEKMQELKDAEDFYKIQSSR